MNTEEFNMKMTNVLLGVVIGAAGGVAISILNAPKSGEDTIQSLKNTKTKSVKNIDDIKYNALSIKDSFMQTKEESVETFQSLGDEIKTMIENFKQDIEPNINNIKKDVEGLQQNGETIQKEVSDMTNIKKK